LRILRSGDEGFDRYLSEVEERVAQDGVRLEREVRSILEDVRKRGDDAVVHYTNLFDGVRIPVQRLRVTRREVEDAYPKVPRDFLGTLKKAAHRIRSFHRSVAKKASTPFIPEAGGLERGIRLGQRIRAIEKVGISPAILVASDLAGVDQIYRVGGAQAIAALAYGTASIPKVDKIVGPGNQYVATAKRLLYGAVDIDMVAGPSEILIIADETGRPSYVASDLISQAEHDEMALAILITTSEAFGEEVRKELERQLSSLKRERIARASLERKGAILVVKDLHQAIDLANRIAPEHLELSTSNALSLAKHVKHAGAIFLGPYTPEAVGDYLAGPNHILPTAGTARFSSPLGVEDFVKRTNLMRFSQSALRRFDKDVKRFAEWEGLEGHYRSVRVRVKRKNDL
jgi:histidinol dehydrogenase